MTLTQVNSRGVEETLRWTLGASGTNHYTFTGPGLTGTVNDPTIYLSRGQTYVFENNNSSNAHPFRIQSVAGSGGAAYNTGVTNNGGAGSETGIILHNTGGGAGLVAIYSQKTDNNVSILYVHSGDM